MKLSFLFLIITLISCSKSENINRLENTIDSRITLTELSVTNSATGIAGLIDQQLGNLEQGVTIVQDLSIKNTTSAAVNFNAAVNDSQVTLDKTFCTASAIRGTCKFVATIKASQTLGQQISSITINGQTLNYVLNVIPKVVPLPALSYSNPMDVGITQSAIISKSFQVINQSLSTLSYIVDSSQTNSQFSIAANCPSVDRNRSCPINITFTPTTPLVSGIVNSTFKLNGMTINVQATVESPSTLPLVIPPVNPWDFGDIEQGKSKTLSISITNRTGISDSGPMVVSGLSNFTNPVITCSSSWVRARTCKITLTFNATAKSIQEYLETLTLKGSKIQLDLNLRANVTASSTVVACSLVNSSSYGININNVATVIGNIPLCQVATCTDSNLYEVSPDQLSCIDKAIPCQLSDVQSNGWNTQNFLTISGTKVGSDVSQCSISTCNPNFTVNSTIKSCELTMCSMINAESFGVNLANVATVSGSTPNCVVSSCSNSSLYDIAPDQKSCVDKHLACTLSDSQSNGWNITNAQTPTGTKVGTNITQCSVSVCNPNFALNTINKTCDSISCSLLNASSFGVNLLNVSSVSGATPNCIVSSCLNPSLYDIAPDQKSCIDKPLSCTLTDAQANGWNINNAQTASGIKVGTNISQCSVSNCNTNFTLNSLNKTCDSISCTTLNSVGNGLVSILNVASVSGNLPNCTISSCNIYYKPNVSNSSCVAKLCNELSAGELSSLGFNLTNSTISGTYPSCSLTCTSGFQQLSGDSKSCVDRNPTGSISFTKSFTNTLSNTVNISSSNAQQIQFYSNSTCTTLSDSVISLPLTQTTRTIPSGDGVKFIYAKLLNGTASSACLSASIILDQVSPSIVISNPTSNQSITTSQLSISGTCSDLTSGISGQLGVAVIGGASTTVSCVGNNFSATLNISGLTYGTQYTLRVIGSDSATNSTTLNQLFVRSGVCVPNSSNSCSITNGQGSQSCSSDGYTLSSCSIVSCNSGFELVNSACVQSSSVDTLTGQNNSINKPHVFNNQLYFNAQNTSFISKIFRINSTDQINQVNTGSTASQSDSMFANPTSTATRLYFSGRVANSSQNELYSISTTNTVLKLTSGPTVDVINFIFENNIYFNYFQSMLITLFYNITSGLVSDSSMISGPGYQQSTNFLEEKHIIHNNNLYYLARQSSGFAQVYKIQSGTQAITSLPFNRAVSEFSEIVKFNNSLYVKLMEQNTGQTFLYKINDNDTTEQVQLPINYSTVHNLTVANNSLYFSSNLFGEVKLLRLNTDGTISEINGIRGPSGTPVATVNFNNVLYASASTPAAPNNRKLFRVNSDNSVTQVLSVSSSDDGIMFNEIYNNKLYFTANNGTGNFMYSIDSLGITKTEFSFAIEGITSIQHYTGFNNRLYFVATKGGMQYLFRIKNP